MHARTLFVFSDWGMEIVVRKEDHCDSCCNVETKEMKLLPADATWGWSAFAVLFAVLGWYHTTHNLSISLPALPTPSTRLHPFPIISC